MSKKFIIFGGNRLKEDGPVTYLINYLKRKKIKYILVTDHIHIKKETKSRKTFKEHLNKNEYIVFKKFNEDKVIKLIDKNTYGISINAIWKFPKSIINKFNKRLFNYHAADLPEARGAANISWKILNNNIKNISINIHNVDQDFDTGRVLQTKKIKLGQENLPKAILKKISNAEKSFLKNFIITIIKGGKIKSIKQKGSVFYWPRLNSDIHGKINWDWEAKDIVLFIKAFSHPYNGAFSFLNNQKVIIFNAQFFKKKFHPYTNGIIFRETKNKIFISNFNGYVVVLKKDLKYKKIKNFIGKRFV